MTDYHDHRGYASERHDHNEYTDEYHRHYDLNREDDRLQQEISGLRDAVRDLGGELASAWTRIGELQERLHDHEQATPHPEVTS